VTWLLLRSRRQFRFSAATKSVVNRPQYRIVSGAFMTFSRRCSSLSLCRRPAGGYHAEHVRRALRLTLSGGEPVTSNDSLGAQRRGRFRREPPCGSSLAREACEISMSESGIDRAADLAIADPYRDPPQRGILLTPVASNTRSHHTSAPPRRRSSRVLAAELAGYRSAECLRVDRECRRRCDPEPA
jgi:hypothetical protein